MKIKNPSLIFVWMDGRTEVEAQSNMPLQLLQSWGHSKTNKQNSISLAQSVLNELHQLMLAQINVYSHMESYGKSYCQCFS